ncbi:hypothetical protein [Paraburkholderia sp. RAU2J]|uniref:hypothetical protein n=1 Tax=Paraburkholderia sp. RAU2J TaxID=1938810 RepID=UPI0011C49911|nr:hypothetical protein [Paraburkholderia sp. RAU2J]
MGANIRPSPLTETVRFRGIDQAACVMLGSWKIKTDFLGRDVTSLTAGRMPIFACLNGGLKKAPEHGIKSNRQALDAK